MVYSQACLCSDVDVQIHCRIHFQAGIPFGIPLQTYGGIPRDSQYIRETNFFPLELHESWTERFS